MSLITDREPRRHRITVREYRRMAELGLLTPDTRVELIEGEIIDLEPHGERHRSLIQSLSAALESALGERAVVQSRGAIHLDKLSQPEADLAVLQLRGLSDSQQRPTAIDTCLLIEIAERSLDYFREVKVPLYARAGVPEVWIFDLAAHRFDFFRGPSEGSYVELTSTSEPGLRSLSALPGATVDLSFIRQLPRSSR